MNKSNDIFLWASCTFKKENIQIEAKVVDGDVRILSSVSGIVKASKSTFEALLRKHPSPFQGLYAPAPDAAHLNVLQDQVMQAIRNFPNGSSSGIDGIRPHHLKDLTYKSIAAELAQW